MKFSSKQINASHLFVSIKLDVICFCVFLSLVAMANGSFSHDGQEFCLTMGDIIPFPLFSYDSVWYESTILFDLSASKSHL